MKLLVNLVLFLFLMGCFAKGQSFGQSRAIGINKNDCNSQQLEFISNYSVKQLSPAKTNRFDLSGMVYFQDKILAIADKEWDKYIYLINYNDSSFSYTNYTDLCFDTDLDLEGIDYYAGKFYLIDETTDDVLENPIETCRLRKLEIPWDQFNIDITGWGNKGFEGIAIDGNNSVMYLAKEREPRRIFRIDLKSLNITEPFIDALSEGGGHDISELKYEDGFLYILERGLGQITRINVENGQKISVSYQQYVYKDGKRWFTNANPQFGMAESFILTKNEIWLGIDNNGDPVSDFGKTYGLKEGKSTAIIVFKRPEGF